MHILHVSLLFWSLDKHISFLSLNSAQCVMLIWFFFLLLSMTVENANENRSWDDHLMYFAVYQTLIAEFHCSLFGASHTVFSHSKLGLLGWFSVVSSFSSLNKLEGFTCFLSVRTVCPPFKNSCLTHTSPQVHPCHDQNIYPKAMFCLPAPKDPARLATTERVNLESFGVHK